MSEDDWCIFDTTVCDHMCVGCKYGREFEDDDMTFKTEAEVYRYLLEKEGNVVENEQGTKAMFVNGGLRIKVAANSVFEPTQVSIGYYAGEWHPVEKKEWWKVASSGRLLIKDCDGRMWVWSMPDKNGFTPIPSSTIRKWLAEAERVERECNL